MNDPVLLTAAAATCLLVLLHALRARRRRRSAMRAAIAVTQAWTPAVEPAEDGPDIAPSVEAAERQLALILGRMRAWLLDPYDVAASRIRGDDEFEACLDLAARLRERIAALQGAAVAQGPEARSRLRGQILQGLLNGPVGGTVTVRAASSMASDRALRRSPEAGLRVAA
jgi:hypothetical protein